MATGIDTADVITIEEAIRLLEEVKADIKNAEDAAEKNKKSDYVSNVSYTNLVGRAMDQLNANNLKVALGPITGIINMADEKGNAEIFDKMNVLRDRIKKAPDKQKFEIVIDELVSSEKIFRGQIQALATQSQSLINNPKIKKNAGLVAQLNEIFGAINEINQNFVVQNKGKTEVDVGAFAQYVEKMELLNAKVIALQQNTAYMKAIAKASPSSSIESDLMSPVQRLPRFAILFKEIISGLGKYNKENTQSPRNVVGINDANLLAIDAATRLNNTKGQRELVSEMLKDLSAYNANRIGSAHKKEKAEVVNFLTSMTADRNVNEIIKVFELREKLDGQLKEINKNRKPSQKAGRYSNLLIKMIKAIDEKLSSKLEQLHNDIESKNGELDVSAIRANWSLYTSDAFSKIFMEKVVPNLSDAQLFNFTQALMTSHLISDNKSDSMLRANGHLSGMLYKELAKRLGYDPLTNPDKPTPPPFVALNNLVYKNIRSIQDQKAKQVADKAATGMNVGSTDDYAKSVKSSAVSAILFAFDPTLDYMANTVNFDMAVIDGYKKNLDKVTGDEQAVNHIVSDEVMADVTPNLPENYFQVQPDVANDLTDTIDPSTLYSETQSSEDASIDEYGQELGESEIEEDLQEDEEFDDDGPSADDIVSILKQRESEDLQASLDEDVELNQKPANSPLGPPPSLMAHAEEIDRLLKEQASNKSPPEKSVPIQESAPVQSQADKKPEDVLYDSIRKIADDIKVMKVEMYTSNAQKTMTPEKAEEFYNKAVKLMEDAYKKWGEITAAKDGKSYMYPATEPTCKGAMAEAENLVRNAWILADKSPAPKGRDLKNAIQAGAGNTTSRVTRNDKMAERLARIKERKDAAVAGKYDAKPNNSQPKTNEPEAPEQETPRSRGPGRGQG